MRTKPAKAKVKNPPIRDDRLPFALEYLALLQLLVRRATNLVRPRGRWRSRRDTVAERRPRGPLREAGEA